MPALLERPREVSTLPSRRFGKTDEQVPVLGLGTAPGGFGLPDPEAIALIHAAIDHGVTYLDTAPGYERAQTQLREVLPTRRSEVFLVTKAWADSADGILSIHEQNLRDLGVENVDLLFAHCIGSFEPERLLAPDGAIAGLAAAKRRGLARHIGFTAHHHPWKAEQLLERALAGDFELDAVMLAMNFADRHTYGFEERVLPLARRLDLGVAVMKVYGGAKDMDYAKNRDSALTAIGNHSHSLAFRYALGLEGVAVAVIGMFNRQELERNAGWARNWEGLTGEEFERLDVEGRSVAGAWGAHFGAVR